MSSSHIAVVIPAFRVENHIADVISEIPSFVQTIIAVEDQSPDNTGHVLDTLARTEPRLVVINHEQNQGVGGATMSGYQEALRREVDVIVKLDGDGQMDASYIERLIAPIIAGRCEYVKGNRFRYWSYLQEMPAVRKIGNLGLSFLVKAATGYWNVFDPTNGFTAISGETLRRLDFRLLEERYLFETSMLSALYLIDARIKHVPMQAKYGSAPSSLKVFESFFQFLVYLPKVMIRRFIHRYILMDFTAISLFVILGLISVSFGATFGIYHWIQSLRTMRPATAGTVMVSAMPVILGFQLLLQAVVLDIQNVPK
ncbi:MAG: Undecaprenyl-phosphate mannosyltransferase [Chloroflexi bacterium]|nr:Undecaprenyl-phosphate mannosyltransferase [Chloroflexota bacterium]